MSLISGVTEHWPLNEASSNCIGAHAGNDGTDFNTVGSGTGNPGVARDFESSSSEYFKVPNNSTLQTGNIDWELIGWVNLESVLSSAGTAQSIITKRDAFGTVEYWIRQRGTSNRFEFAVSPTGSTSIVRVEANNYGAPVAGVWVLVDVWHDSVNDLIGIKINNGPADTVSHSGGVFVGSNPVVIGSNNDQNGTVPIEFLDGRLQCWTFYKGRLLSDSERTQYYNSGTVLPYPFSSNHVGTGFANINSFGVGESLVPSVHDGTGFADEDTFGTGSFTLYLESTGTGISDEDIFGTGTVNGIQSSLGSGFLDVDKFGTGQTTLLSIHELGTVVLSGRPTGTINMSIIRTASVELSSNLPGKIDGF